MITIIFATHATTTDNERGIASGHADVDLSDVGIEQARALGERYRDEPIDAVFCSDLRRAYRTAGIAFAGRGIPITRDQRLRECDYGELTRQPRAIVEERKLRHVSTPFPGGESYDDTANRMRSFLTDLLRAHDGATVMIIGHRATQYGLEHWVLGKPLEEVVVAPWEWQPGWNYQLDRI